MIRLCYSAVCFSLLLTFGCIYAEVPSSLTNCIVYIDASRDYEQKETALVGFRQYLARFSAFSPRKKS